MCLISHSSFCFLFLTRWPKNKNKKSSLSSQPPRSKTMNKKQTITETICSYGFIGICNAYNDRLLNWTDSASLPDDQCILAYTEIIFLPVAYVFASRILFHLKIVCVAANVRINYYAFFYCFLTKMRRFNLDDFVFVVDVFCNVLGYPMPSDNCLCSCNFILTHSQQIP